VPHTKRAFRPTLVLLLLFVFFALPMFLASWYYGAGAPGAGQTNKGTLIAKGMNVRALEGSTVKKSTWQMLYVTNAKTCDKTCKNILQDLTKIHVAMGKNYEKVTRVMLSTHPLTLPKPPGQPLYQVTIAPKVFTQLLQQFPSPVANTPNTWALFISDARGRIMMGYRPNENRKKLLWDLRKLVKINKDVT